jgi:hypothetical protein
MRGLTPEPISGRARVSDVITRTAALVVGVLVVAACTTTPDRSVIAPMTGATPGSSSAPGTPVALPTAAPVDWGKLIGHAYIAISAIKGGQAIVLLPEAPLGLGFNDASHFGASFGCNGGGGVYEIRDGRLVTTNVHMTLKGCLGARGELEAWYLSFLQSSPTISRDTTGLVLSSGDTVVTYVDE